MRWGMNRSSAEGCLGDGVGIEGDDIPLCAANRSSAAIWDWALNSEILTI